MSASLALVVALSVVRQAGMVARRMRRMRISDSVTGYMPQRRSMHPEKRRLDTKGLVDNNPTYKKLPCKIVLHDNSLFDFIFYRNLVLIIYISIQDLLRIDV